jgi:hypothetical protein
MTHAPMTHALMSMAKPLIWKNRKNQPSQGVIKRNWVATGRIDFATRLNGNAADADQCSEFRLLVEERRVVESVTGLENLEIQWRLATLKEAKAVISQYHRYLSENALIKSVVEESAFFLPPTKKIQMVPESPAA